jgi:hypothetical protein
LSDPTGKVEGSDRIEQGLTEVSGSEGQPIIYVDETVLIKVPVNRGVVG